MLPHRLTSDSPPLLADGPMGTMLHARGLPGGAWAASWSLARPDAVLDVHLGYAKAGAELLLANSFGAADAATNEAAVRLARAAGARYVVGSLASGAGEAQVAALAAAGVDGFWLETQLSLPEARATLRHCHTLAPELPAIVTFTFHRADGLSHAGETPDELARVLEAEGAAAVGANCGVGPAGLAPLLAAMAGACALPLALKPNAGPPGQPMEPAAWVAAMRPLLGPRVRVVGGCCGTTPAHVAALAAMWHGA